MISNSITLFRLALLAPLFWLLLGGGGWAAAAIYLAAGLLDVVDGQVARRLHESSRLGGFLDLVGDRLLTLAMVVGLAVGGALSGWTAVAAAVLVGRCLVVASLNEALAADGPLAGARLEPAKVALQFAGLALLAAPDFTAAGVASRGVGGVLIGLSALLALATLADYLRTGVERLRSR